MNIKNFLKTYKWYLVGGMLIGLLLGVIAWFLISRNKEEKLADNSNKEILSPFSENKQYTSLSLPENKDLFNTELLKVYSLTDRKSDLGTVVNKLNPNFKELFSSEYAITWKDGDDMLAYNYNTGIMNLNSKKGLNIDFKISSKQDVNNFLSEYIGYLGEEDIEVVDNKGGTYTYNGKFLLNGYAFGSVNLNMHSFEIEVSSLNKITEFSILLFDEGKVSEYSKYTPILESEIINNEKILIKYVSFDEKYYKKSPYLQASAKIESITPSKIQKTFLFKDFDYGYIFPAYVVYGEARLKDSQDTKYVAVVELYMCAIDPKYVKENTSLEEVFLDPAQ
ncbi:MAG: hypothetical protein AB9915_01220 [Candidatus Dojkabacteria bacterium]